MMWRCPHCQRSFRQTNQRHACGTGTGSPTTLLKNRPASLFGVFGELEAFVRSLGPVEIVTRDRYALFRTTRIFADLTVTRDALRVVFHLARRVLPQDALSFVKVVAGDRRVSHVVLVRTSSELRVLEPFIREAYETAVTEDAS